MRFKHVISTLALAMVTAFGVAAGLQPREFKVASATDPEPVYFYMIGSMNGWNTSSDAYPIQSNDQYGTAKLAYTFAKGDEFKITRELGTWGSGEINYTSVFGTGALKASPCFVKGAGDSTNIVCDVAGTYWLRIAQTGPSSYYLFIDKEDNLLDFDTATVYIQLQSWSDTYVYVFDQTTFVNTMEFFSGYGGMPVSAMGSVTEGVNFKGELGGIACMSIPFIKGYQSNTKFIINNGGTGEGNQSGNLDIVNGYYYWNTGTSGNSALGAAAAVVLEMSDAIKYANDSSLCNLSKSDAQALLDLYDDCTAQNIVDITTFYSWEEKGSSDKKNFTGLEVIAQLTKIANAPDSSVLFPHELSINNGSVIVIIIVSTTVAAISAGLFFMFKKRKEK